MLIYICSDGYYHNIMNLDYMVKLMAYKNEINMCGLDGQTYLILKCESEEEANKIIKKIYFNMTHNIKSMILDLEEFRKEETETARTRKASENCISKADIKTYLSAPDANGDRIIYESDLDLLPPVTPQRPKGKWIRNLIRNAKDGCIGAKMICSECNNDNKHDEYMKFCPNCGAEMEIE